MAARTRWLSISAGLVTQVTVATPSSGTAAALEVPSYQMRRNFEYAVVHRSVERLGDEWQGGDTMVSWTRWSGSGGCSQA
jgi:hypothetical protein